MSRSRTVLGAVAAACGLLALPGSAARAEIAVLTNGYVLKISEYELAEQRMRLQLEDGGSLWVPLERIERIVDDEIEPEPEAVPVAPPAFALEFDEGVGVPRTPYGDLFYEAGRRHRLNPVLLAAMARAESAYDAGALSIKGARGLLQLMPATAERFGVRAGDLWQPERNVEAAAKYLRFLIREFDGELALVLAAYNAGEGAVRRYGGVPPYRETRNYVQRIYGFLGLGPEAALSSLSSSAQVADSRGRR